MKNRFKAALAAAVITTAVPIGATILPSLASAHHAEVQCVSSYAPYDGNPGSGSWIVSSVGAPAGVTITSVTGLPAGAVITSGLGTLQVEIQYYGTSISGKAHWSNGKKDQFSGSGNCAPQETTTTTSHPSKPTVGASATCTTITVTSTKDLSNVVVDYSDDPDFKYDGLSGYSFEIPYADGIVGVWIKSGNNQSGDGPGYGEYVPIAAPQDCEAQPADGYTERTDEGTCTTPGQTTITITTYRQDYTWKLKNGEWIKVNDGDEYISATEERELDPEKEDVEACRPVREAKVEIVESTPQCGDTMVQVDTTTTPYVYTYENGEWVETLSEASVLEITSRDLTDEELKALEAECPTEVTAVEPTHNTTTECGVEDTYTIPVTEGVTYYAFALEIGPGVHQLPETQSVTITAQAKAGYVLSNDEFSVTLVGEEVEDCPVAEGWYTSECSDGEWMLTNDHETETIVVVFNSYPSTVVAPGASQVLPTDDGDVYISLGRDLDEAMLTPLDCSRDETTTTTTTTVPEDETTTTTTVPVTTETTVPGAEPTIEIAALGPVCQRDAPYIELTFGGDASFNSRPATVTFTDANGIVVATHTATFQDGATVRFVYPGASVDATGNATDWPGWSFNGTEWVPDPSDDHLRDGLSVLVEVNPEARGMVSYPDATAACAGPSMIALAEAGTVDPGTQTLPATR